MDSIRLKEKTVVLSNQQIIEIGYMAQIVISMGKPPTFDEMNCFKAVFFLFKNNLLPVVDPEYLEIHHEVRDFFKQELSNDWDRLTFEVNPTVPIWAR